MLLLSKQLRSQVITSSVITSFCYAFVVVIPFFAFSFPGFLSFTKENNTLTISFLKILGIDYIIFLILFYYIETNNITMNAFSVQTPDNYQQKCCCILVLDVSGSMDGQPIDELNSGLQDFYNEIKQDTTTADRLEVGIIEFSDQVVTLVDPTLVENFDMPILNCKGTTKMADAVEEAIKVVRAKKDWYKQTGQPYYRPWIILMTDGAPDADQNMNALANEIQWGVAKKEFFFFAVGIGNADMNMLQSISDSGMPPAPMKGLKFSEFFQWLSASMSTITSSKEGDKVNMPNPSSWMNGFSI